MQSYILSVMALAPQENERIIDMAWVTVQFYRSSKNAQLEFLIHWAQMYISSYHGLKCIL